MNTILMTILGSQNLCKYLYYNVADPISQSDIEDTNILLFNNLYPTPIVPQITDEAKSFITIVLDDFKLSQTIFKTSSIIFNIISHIDLWVMPGTGMLRPYSIMSEIDKIFNEQRIFNIGKTLFQSSHWIAANEKFQGYRVIYNVTSFN